MADGMVVVDGVRYRPEDAPKRTKKNDDDTATAETASADAQHKMRRPAKSARTK